MVFRKADKNMTQLQGIVRKLLSRARCSRRTVSVPLLRCLHAVAILCSLAMPLARFYTHSLYNSLQNTAKLGHLTRLAHALIRDLQHWSDLIRSPSTNQIRSPDALLSLYSDASTSVGLGGTLGQNLRARAQDR